ncbi:MAG TPA: hypothetical protein VI997_12165, partial [Candidatus Thermoplasmatota archaeon]|nr:hypothetical protein [Candidatus Thermoplasmatota archaeon]
MAESETLRDFVIRNRHLHPDEALVAVLSMPKVRSWIGDDAGRRDRLTAEFHRLWEETAPEDEDGGAEGAPAPAPTSGRTGPAGPPSSPTSTTHAPATMQAPPHPRGAVSQGPAEVYEEAPQPEGPHTRPHVGPARTRVDEAAATAPVAQRTKPVRQRHEKFLCTSCGGYDIFSESDGEAVRVRCR